MKKLKDLLAKCKITQGFSLLDRDAASITSDSRKVEENGIFVAIKGGTVDGHEFLKDVIQKKPLAIVIEEGRMFPSEYLGVVAVVGSTASIVGDISAQFYGFPANSMFTVGVTGTNGKTSITYMTECILNGLGKSTAVIGTVNHHLKDFVWPSDMTTPDSILLQKRLNEMRNQGANALAIEVSSHALDQGRVDSLNFDVAQFTNLTRDHLDYHETMDAYYKAKEKFFTKLLRRSLKKDPTAIINVDDAYGKQIVQQLKYLKIRTITYGKIDGDIRFVIQKMNFTSSEFEVHFQGDCQNFIIPMSGQHNIYNACAAIGAGLVAGATLEQMAHSIRNFQGVPGRLQHVKNPKGLAVFVDYAHSPDALENVLKSLSDIKVLHEKSKIWTVFGCGGDRDKGKRPLMAQVSQEWSDNVMVTSDNPRTEIPQEIIKDIMAGFSKKALGINQELDRKKAIQKVLQEARPGDVVLIAGKGHEDYQIIGKEKHFFSDISVVQEFFNEWKN